MSHPIVWTIAGSDSGGGAGIQADCKVMNQLGTHSCSVITALTAQNTLGTTDVSWATDSMFSAQIVALQTDLPPHAIKIGMLGKASLVVRLADFLKETPPPFSICDPVLISSSGVYLLEADGWPLLTEQLFPKIDLITPNIPESEHLFKMQIKTPADIEQAAAKGLALGVREVLIKGGHGTLRSNYSTDYWTNGTDHAWLTSPRIETTSTHGTGCMLSSAIAASRARGCSPLESIVLAKSYLNQALRQAPGLGQGSGPMAFNAWDAADQDLPLISQTADALGERASCPTL